MSTLTKMRNTLKASRYMIAAWRIDGDKILMDTEWKDWPTGDFPEALRMLREKISTTIRAQRSAMATGPAVEVPAEPPPETQPEEVAVNG